MKLISMTEFVLASKFPKTREEAESESVLIDNFYNEVCNYASFLKQPLKVEMFVPCDKNANVLEEQIGAYFNSDHDMDLFLAYEKAKEKVLFKGFELKSSKIHENRDYIGWEIYNPSIFINTGNGWQKPEFPDFHTVEDLLSFSKSIELTESAIKQIGL